MAREPDDRDKATRRRDVVEGVKRAFAPVAANPMPVKLKRLAKELEARLSRRSEPASKDRAD